MPSISRIRFTNVVYDHGRKRYIDTIFRFDGYNGILLLENGAGKTVFVQTLIHYFMDENDNHGILDFMYQLDHKDSKESEKEG